MALNGKQELIQAMIIHERLMIINFATISTLKLYLFYLFILYYMFPIYVLLRFTAYVLKLFMYAWCVIYLITCLDGFGID